MLYWCGMASQHSYRITLSNNKTEKQGLDYLIEQDPAFLLPTKDGRRQIMEALGVEKRFARAFDLFRLPGHANNEQEIVLNDTSQIMLVELKTTMKYLPNNPKGFFFGATQNEFELAEYLGDQFRFCFVSLHPESRGYKLLSLEELEGEIVNKRTQFQINL